MLCHIDQRMPVHRSRGDPRSGVSSYLPASDAEEESQHVGLLLLVQLLDVFEGTHLQPLVIEEVFQCVSFL